MRHLLLRVLPNRPRWRWRWAWVALPAGIGLVVLGVLFIRTEPSGPVLELVALGGGGEYARSVRIPASRVDTSATAPEVAARIPLILGIRNTGDEAVRPARLRLSVPVFFRVRLEGRPGTIGRAWSDEGPLIGYRLETRLPEIPPDAGEGAVALRDTLWLEVVIPSFYCATMGDSVPAFISAPPLPVETLASVRLFYALEGGDLDYRQTGLLNVRVDPALLDAPAGDEFDDTDPMRVYPGEAPMPSFSALRRGGSRRSLCGGIGDALQFRTFLWTTPGGGRFFVLHYGGAPRKYLFDLNRNDIIELEIADMDGNGSFEARRSLRLPIPRFLMPRRDTRRLRFAAADTLSAEEFARLRVFGTAMRGPYQPRSQPPDTTRDLYVFAPGMTVREGDDDPAGRTSAPGRRGPAGLPDPGISDVEVPPAAERAAGGDAPAPADSVAVPAPDQTVPDRPAPEPPADQGRDLLGVPVDSVRASGSPPDTSGG